MAAPDTTETVVRVTRKSKPDSKPAGLDKGSDRKPGKFETIVRAKRNPPAEARGTADRGTGANQYVLVPATRSPPPLGTATACRATEQLSISPAISHPPASNAFKGIELYYIVGDEYLRGALGALKAYKSDHYWVVPQVRKEGGEVVAYVAYNPDLRRSELVIGPNELGFFFEHETLYKWLASSTYPFNGQPTRYEVQHGRMISSAFRGNPEGMVKHFGAEWDEALRDPVWYMRTLGSVATMKTSVPTSESATIIPRRGTTTWTQPPIEGSTTSTLPPAYGATSSTASSTEAAVAARARQITPPQPPDLPVPSTPVVPASALQPQAKAQPGTDQTATKTPLNEPSPYARGGPLTPEERLRAERLLNRSLGQAPAEPVPVTRWGGQSETVATRVIKAGPDGKPLIVEFSGRGVNGELVTVRSIAGDGGGRVVRLEIRNINKLERVVRDTELARAMKAAGMGDWENNLGHVQPSAAKGAEMPYNLEAQGKNWNQSVAGRATRRTAESQFQKFLDSHPTDILNTEISRNLSKSNALLGERFVITDANGKVLLDVEVTTRGKIIDRVKDGN